MMKVVRFVGREACSSKQYHSLLDDPNAAVIDNASTKANTSITKRLNNRLLQLDLPPTVRDFLDLAITIYISDELSSRAQQKDYWTRQFDVVLPVFALDLWERCEDSLADNLKFLSGDIFNFSWKQRQNIPRYSNHRIKIPRGYYDTVCLFSGGLDSLLGAYRLLKEGRKVLLVGHQADGVTSTAQKNLFNLLQRKFGNSVGYIQFGIGRSRRQNPIFQLPNKVENSHRPRSFLFLAIATAVASSAESESIVIPENGLIALNVPLQISRLGTLSTRTAHPIFISSFREVVHALNIFSGEILNPFLFLSKTEMLEKLDPDERKLAKHTVSCSHPDSYRWRKETSRKKHCGYCVPCIYRRIAMIEASLDDKDDYLDDIFNDYLSLSPLRQVDFAALVRFAQKIISLNTNELQMMVLSHGFFSPDVGQIIGPRPVDSLLPWANMLKKWSTNFLDKINFLCPKAVKESIGL